ncbi:MAG TPA: hypothetical protein VJY42_02275 [Candidatus Methanomethylophilaceae archaeon]|nr:hypothetical protein [Candidatus Methanomethylophilaceae archaeon]
MKSSTLWFISILSATLLLMPVFINDASAELQGTIYVIQDGRDVELSVDTGSGGSVVWDLGDGRIVNGSSVKTTYNPGLYLVKAIVLTAGKLPVLLQKYVAIYNPVPGENSVIEAERNIEFRYSIYNASPNLTVRDSSGKIVSWLTYDADQRVLTGIPRDTGFYYVFFGDKSWIISVVDTGETSDLAVYFNAKVSDDKITASPKVMHDTLTRYSWSLTDIKGQLKSSYEGKNLNITAEPGYYVLKLTIVGIEGTASYSQIVSVHPSEVSEIPIGDVAENTPVLPIILGSVTILTLMIATFNRSPVLASISVLFALAAILMVV